MDKKFETTKDFINIKRQRIVPPLVIEIQLGYKIKLIIDEIELRAFDLFLKQLKNDGESVIKYSLKLTKREGYNEHFKIILFPNWGPEGEEYLHTQQLAFREEPTLRDNIYVTINEGKIIISPLNPRVSRDKYDELIAPITGFLEVFLKQNCKV